jgi:molybdopterin molybdotransferase
VDETIQRVAATARALPAETAPLAQALGRVLRQTLTAPEDQPPFDVSAVDGYAIRQGDNADSFQVVAQLRAGDWQPREVGPGQAVQIATGAALPGDGLQVVMKEYAHRVGDQVRLQRQGARNIRFRGENARAGTALVQAGTRLTPGALALLASAGCAQPQVTRRPRVLHVATGNEIVPPDHPPRPGQIRDSNTILVGAFLRQSGIEPEQCRMPEDETQTRELIAGRLAAAVPPDLLLISGGASVGEHDFTRRLLEHFGFEVLISRTTTRPGKPLIFAARGPLLAFGLPGNPLAHFVCLNLYVRAALLGLGGLEECVGFTPGRLAVDFDAGASDRETLWPARYSLAGGEAALTPLPWRSSGDLTALASANALARIPPATGSLTHGTRINFLPTDIWT